MYGFGQEQYIKLPMILPIPGDAVQSSNSLKSNPLNVRFDYANFREVRLGTEPVIVKA